ncbi:MAG: toprim domain-containing protein, partial [Candidatus Hydrogenedentes bacterium]|nr:toprim domain-containing protein [Candidatus Hydrogenedentota bacterium]
TLGFVPILAYDRELSFPALIGRADNALGLGRAIQRIYLNPEKPKKAPVQPNKVTLGANKGCAVRLGGVAETIAVCEGIETGLAVAALTNFTMPVWACLGTSGLMGIDVPVEVTRVEIYPDGDRPFRKKGSDYIPSEPAGLVAACALRDRLLAQGVYVVMNPPPPAGSDYLDALKAMRELEHA